MNIKEQSKFKINEYKGESKESKATEMINKLDLCKVGIGAIGLSFCIPYLIPSITTTQLISMIPLISKGLTVVGTTALGGVSAYGVIDIISESIKNKNVDRKLLSNNSTNNKDDSHKETHKQIPIFNLNKRDLECCLDKEL